MSSKLLVLFLFLTLQVQAQDQANPSAIQSIRKHFYATNADLETFDKIAVDENITGYCKDGKVYKIVKKYAEKGFIELYYKEDDGDLYFIFTSNYGQENRYYFHKNKMIRWIDANKDKIVPANKGWKVLHNNHKGFLQIYDKVFYVYLKKELGLKDDIVEDNSSGFAELLESSIVDFSSDVSLFKKVEKAEMPKELKNKFIQSAHFQKIKKDYAAALIRTPKDKIELENHYRPTDNLKYFTFSKANTSPIHVFMTAGGHPCGAPMYYEYWGMFIEKDGQLQLVETHRINNIFQIGGSEILYIHSLEVELIIEKLLPNGEMKTLLQQPAYSQGCGC